MRETWIIAMCLVVLASYPSFSCVAEFESATTHPQRLEISFELYNGHLVVVKGTVGPLNKVKIVVDTGKSPSAISKELAEQLGLKGKTESLVFSNGDCVSEDGFIVYFLRVDANYGIKRLKIKPPSTCMPNVLRSVRKMQRWTEVEPALIARLNGPNLNSARDAAVRRRRKPCGTG